MNYLEIILFVITLASLIVDMSQTLRIKNNPYLHETNLILGMHPTDIKVIVYFIFWILAVIIGFILAPVVWFYITSSLILGVEVTCIRNNLKLKLGW